MEDQVDPLADNTHQLHDFDPGIAPDGLFWTFRVPNRRVSVESDDLGEGASLSLKGLRLLDYGTLANALVTHATPPDPAMASFTLRWNGKTGDTTAEDSGSNRFRYEGILTHASLTWSARVPSKNFAFRSDSTGSFETFAALVNERNGSFF